MFERRINPIELDRLLAENLSLSEAGRRMGFSKQAISQFLQKRKQGVKLRFPPARTHVDFGGIKVLKKMLSVVMKEIDYLNKQIAEAKPEERASWNFQRLKYLAEARKELGLGVEVEEKLFAIDERQKFENYVLSEMEKMDEGTRDEFIEGLRCGESVKRFLKQG